MQGTLGTTHGEYFRRFDGVSHCFVASLFPRCHAVLLRNTSKVEGRTYELEERTLPDVVIESVDQLKETLTALRTS